ncbi:MAG: histidine phosphatase family protein [Actinomycetota bacterium]
MILFLVRHALTPVTGTQLTGRLPGFNLSDTGRQQAQSAGQRLTGVPLKAVYSSPLERCMQTAGAIAELHKLQVQQVPEMTEVDYGDWQGKSLKALSATKGWQKLRARPGDFRFPGGETIREAQTRAVGALEALRVKHKDRPVVVCSHADMIRLAVAAYLGLAIDLYDRINIAPASITTVHLGDGVPRLLNLGDAGSQAELFESFASALRQRPGGKK